VNARLGSLVIDADDPEAVARFWGGVLGGTLQTMVDGVEVRVPDPECRLRFLARSGRKRVKNRVHPDIYVRSVEPLIALGAVVLADYPPERMTLADVEGNEFCAFLDPVQADGVRTGRIFAVCTDSDRPEELARWWADRLAARMGPGTDGTPRWLYDCAGWPELVWKFVRVTDARVSPNRWRWTVHGDGAGLLAAGATADRNGWLRDPQGNEFELR
jgi:Glyoxalase-like domain